MNNLLVPIDIEGNSQFTNIKSKLFCESATMMINGKITNETASEYVSQLIYLQKNFPEKDIFLFINSPGGDVTEGLAIYDVMKSITNDIVTIVQGQASSMGAFLAAGGTKGKRYTFHNSVYMIHQPLGGAKGQVSDIIIQAEHIKKIRDRLNRILARNTGQSLKRIIKDCERDSYMNAEQAVAYGLADHIIEEFSDIYGEN